MTSAYPLQWPNGRPRVKMPVRSQFNKKVTQAGKGFTVNEALTVADALGRLQHEVDLLGAQQYVLSTNLQLRLDGLPRSSQAEPADRGVALYFHLSGKPHCLPCDRYDRVADNIAAIAKHIEATRAIARYGVADVREMFAGFAALPAPGARRNWRDVLGFPSSQSVTKADLLERHRKLAKESHPDAEGGSTEKMAEINRARDEAVKELGL